MAASSLATRLVSVDKNKQKRVLSAENSQTFDEIDKVVHFESYCQTYTATFLLSFDEYKTVNGVTVSPS